MKVLERNKVDTLVKTFQYSLKDRRKQASLLIILTLPVVIFSWRFVPEGIQIPHYGELQYFVWTISINFALVMITSAWFLSTPRRDFATQIIVMGAVLFGVYLTFDTLPFFDVLPVWLDILITLLVFAVISTYLYYVYRNYIDRNVDYKQLHDGIVHDLHHQRFLNSISRLEGLMKVAEMEEPYKSLCEDEIADLKDSVAYIADKYKALH